MFIKIALLVVLIVEKRRCKRSQTLHHTMEVPLQEYDVLINGWQLAKMKKSIPDMSLP